MLATTYRRWRDGIGDGATDMVDAGLRHFVLVAVRRFMRAFPAHSLHILDALSVAQVLEERVYMGRSTRETQLEAKSYPRPAMWRFLLRCRTSSSLALRLVLRPSPRDVICSTGVPASFSRTCNHTNTHPQTSSASVARGSGSPLTRAGSPRRTRAVIGSPP